ncbi:hypothetical protein TNCT_319711 [Trichonephila clavata]|uniref:Uncharacterized protein n=1 Tax=Trichonephila clavata TaxID=2740835 RepID=A0A8X6LJN8_TRICU|nr:hypothetical protein TNCT_319711 [Trichonephila clavata]
MREAKARAGERNKHANYDPDAELSGKPRSTWAGVLDRQSAGKSKHYFSDGSFFPPPISFSLSSFSAWVDPTADQVLVKRRRLCPFKQSRDFNVSDCFSHRFFFPVSCLCRDHNFTPSSLEMLIFVHTADGVWR